MGTAGWLGGGVQFDFTANSLRAHFDFTSNSLRFHIELTSIMAFMAFMGFAFFIAFVVFIGVAGAIEQNVIQGLENKCITHACHESCICIYNIEIDCVRSASYIYIYIYIYMGGCPWYLTGHVGGGNNSPFVDPCPSPADRHPIDRK